MKSNNFVTSYRDPDTDGVMSAIGYSYLAYKRDNSTFKPVVFGDFNKETKFLANTLKIRLPKRVTTLPRSSKVAVVDTHYPPQLPDTLDLNNIIHIIDHHPGESVDHFPNAKVQNEKVGASATLISEHIRQSSLDPPLKIRQGLASAIVSNTLNFAAQSTHNRDHKEYMWLTKGSGLEDKIIRGMFNARSEMSDLETIEALKKDFKEYGIKGVSVGISQIEMVNLDSFVSSNDIQKTIKEIKRDERLDYVIFNGTDILNKYSVIIVESAEIENLLNDVLDLTFESGIAHLDEVSLRKTHVVPALEQGLV